MILKSLDNLVEVTQHLYPKRPTMVDLGVLIVDGVKTIKIENKRNYYLITYQFKIDENRYKEVKNLLGNVDLTTHRWHGVNQKFITVTISQKFDINDLFHNSLMHKPMKDLATGSDD